MGAILEGKITYAKVMAGKSKDGKDYEFLSFVLLDQEEGEKWAMQVGDSSPLYSELKPLGEQLTGRKVRVSMRTYTTRADYDKEGKPVIDAKTGKIKTRANFFVDKLKFTDEAATTAKPKS